ncbi:M23 family metallopeptidase [Clostridia bacterium]|nr:M23 family metallopeptidase [Clostridia bacterium]
MGHISKEGKRKSAQDKSRYRSPRSHSWGKKIGLVLAKLECASITISEMVGQAIRNTVALPGKFLMRTLGRFNIRPNKRATAIAVCTMSAAFLVYFVASSFPNAYAVELDSETVAVVADYADVEIAVDQYLAANSEHYQNIHYTDNIEYMPVRVDKKEISTEEEVASLCEKLNFVAVGYKMYIDGEQVAVLQDESDGQRVIDEIVASYEPEVSFGELKITEIRVAESVEYEKAEVDISSFTDKETFENYLLNGEEVQKTYTVKKNDTLSQIAERFSLSTTELRAANPSHNESNSYLQIGEVLNLNVVEKPLHVVAEGTLVKEESIPYKTTYVNDSTLWKGQYKTIQQGEAGSKQVEYAVTFENGRELERVEVAEVVINDPTNKEVASGTKYIMASRGDGGSGDLAWPLRGRISSPFGWRSSGFHSGLDIAASSGTPVYAAESGVVTFCSWGGGYGNLIKVDHSNGVETRYAHLSAFKVSYGQEVERGDLIGLVGSTGNSTGPHCHFEVRINGVAKNPINYLS